MTTDIFLQNFDLLADAPGGVKRLRELILQLAVRGKLVPQRAEESEVHHEGHEEREVKKRREQEVSGPYPVPQGWRWTTLRKVSRDLGQKIPDKVFTYKERGVIGENVQVLRPEEAPSRARKLVAVVREYRESVEAMWPEYPPWLQARLRGLLASLHVT